jgi:hypothetical protein
MNSPWCTRLLGGLFDAGRRDLGRPGVRKLSTWVIFEMARRPSGHREAATLAAGGMASVSRR